LLLSSLLSRILPVFFHPLSFSCFALDSYFFCSFTYLSFVLYFISSLPLPFFN